MGNKAETVKNNAVSLQRAPTRADGYEVGTPTTELQEDTGPNGELSLLLLIGPT